MKLLSYDPCSYKNLGWAFYNQKELITGTHVYDRVNKLNTWSGLHRIYECVDASLSWFQPDVVVLEQTGSFRGGFVTSQVTQCIGAILAACGKYHGLNLHFTYPSRVKKLVVGRGNADKDDVRKAVEAWLLAKGLSIHPCATEHEVDAVASIISIANQLDTLFGIRK